MDLTFDHRWINGVGAASFMADIRKVLKNLNHQTCPKDSCKQSFKYPQQSQSKNNEIIPNPPHIFNPNPFVGS